jgi:hypothetical protein
MDKQLDKSNLKAFRGKEDQPIPIVLNGEHE